MKPPIIDTQKSLELVHRAFTLCKDPHGADSDLWDTASSAFSAVLLYIKNKEAPVQQKHFQAIQALEKAMEGR